MKNSWRLLIVVIGLLVWGVSPKLAFGAECLGTRMLDKEKNCEKVGSGESAYCAQRWESAQTEQACTMTAGPNYCKYSLTINNVKCKSEIPNNNSGNCEVVNTVHSGTCWAAGPAPAPAPSQEPTGGGGDAGINYVNTGTVGSSTIVKYPAPGRPRIYFYGLDIVKISLKIYYEGRTKFVPLINDADYVDLDADIASGSSVMVRAYDDPDYKFPAYGWKEPKNNKCMQTDISGIIEMAKFFGKPLVSTQCWADSDSASEGYDYDDWVLIFSYQSGILPSPSPSPGVSPSPGASASPAPKPSFVIHKFLDANKNGVRETGESATNRTWEFEYQIDGGEKQNYMIEPGEEEGEKIIVNKGVKIKVSELGQEGWLNTTGAELTKTLSDPKLYTFYFGNWPVNGIVPPPAGGFPPTQPDTGTPTWLTLGATGLAAVLLIVKWLWL